MDTLKHGWMFTYLKIAELAELPQRVIDPLIAGRYGGQGICFVFHAQNATVWSLKDCASEMMRGEVTMATADECRKAFDSLLARLSDVDEQTRREIPRRTLSCHITDLGVTFLSTIGPDGAEPLAEAPPDAPRAQVRFSAKSEDVMAIAARPQSFARLWLTRRVRVDASFGDIAILRKFL